MNDEEILRRAARLAADGRPFALATVVAREPPSSARTGARALVEADGTLHGWLGGSCIEPTIRREARRAMADGEPRLVVFAPDGEADRPRAVVHPMTCHSGGTVDVYVDPQLPAPTLTLYGDSPVTRALAAMAPAAGYRLRAVGVGDAAAYEGAEVVERTGGGRDAGASDPGAVAGPTGDGEDRGTGDGADTDAGAGRRYAVVATMGAWDVEAVREALASGAGYVGLVASPRRAEAVRERLEAAGAEPGDRLVSPAGLDLGAREPGEIAVTILAELVERRRGAAGEDPAGAGASGVAAPPGGGADEDAAGSREHRGAAAGGDGADAPDGSPDAATDPVCGMEVPADGGAPTAEHEGVVYRFCCGGCRERFREDPGRYVAAVESP